MRRNQNTDHAKTLRHFTSKWKTRFDYRKSLNKKISSNASPMEIKVFKYKYILIENKYTFFE